MSGWTHCGACGAGYDERKEGHECLPSLRAENRQLRAFVIELRRMSESLPYHEVGENVRWMLRDLEEP